MGLRKHFVPNSTAENLDDIAEYYDYYDGDEEYVDFYDVIMGNNLCSQTPLETGKWKDACSSYHEKMSEKADSKNKSNTSTPSSPTPTKNATNATTNAQNKTSLFMFYLTKAVSQFFIPMI